MSGRNLVLCLSSAAILIGVIFVFVPLLGDACGNALVGADVSSYLDSDRTDVTNGICTSARVDRWMYVAPMLLGGIAALLAALNSNMTITDDTAATPAAPVTEG